MEKLKNIVTITLAVLFAASIMVFLPKSECRVRQPPPLIPGPLCASQFSLANYACSLVPPASEPSPPSLHNGLDEDQEEDDADDDEEEGHHHNHNHNHQHRHRGHRHKDKHHLPRNIDNCCRWISQIDSSCVCELLFYLPGFATFLMRPLHDFTVRITDSCNVTYSCGGVVRA
ncbi:hypothetical protein I3842_08G104300 [Carya illinoinensis]|uniref:Uncharacterized protein n=1 Tax=Carya illinoinensis TaxID=32201 RepID=A0A922J9W1_CARIL|nr:hypothetical protein I3842_08G104300 [Carya illinoinensis]